MIADLKPYAEYKDSVLPWIDTVPKHWDMAPNRALMRDQREVVGARSSGYTLLSLTLRGVIARDMVNPKGKFPAQFNSYKVVKPDDFVFCLFDIDETPRGVGLSPLKGMITGAYDVFSPTSRINPRFLYYYYLFVDEGKLMKPLYTGLRKTIQRGVFASLKAPLPPPDEQAAIVRFLDWANGRLERAIRAKRKVITLLGEQKQAIIHRAVTRGLAPTVPLKSSGIPWLGNIPQHWGLSPNRAFLRVRKVLVRERHSQFRLLSLTKRGVIVRDLSEMRGKFSADMGTSQEVRSGDLVFCLFDVPETPRTVGLSQHDGMITGAYTVMECSDLEMAKFLELFYIAMDDRKLLSPMYSGLRNTIPKDRFLGAKTPIPPAGERAEILGAVQNDTASLNQTISPLEREIALLREYRTRLVADVVTGKLDVREAAARLPDEVPLDTVEDGAALGDDTEPADEEAAV